VRACAAGLSGFARLPICHLPPRRCGEVSERCNSVWPGRCPFVQSRRSLTVLGYGKSMVRISLCMLHIAHASDILEQPHYSMLCISYQR